MGNRVSEEGHPIGLPFGQDPENHINHCDWAELANIRGARTTGENPSSSAGLMPTSSAGSRATNKALQLLLSSSACDTRYC